MALLAACGGGTTAAPDPTDYLQVGVDPQEEAQTLARSLETEGFRVTATADGDGWSAFAMTRTDGASLARVVTRHGVAAAVDEPTSALTQARGVLALEGSPPTATDVDGDGRVDVVIARIERDRRCWLVLGIDEEGGARPLLFDEADVPAGLCLEAIRDVDGTASPEAIVRVRAHGLARAETPTADLPLIRDAQGVFRRGEAPTRFVADERAARTARVARARALPDAEAVYDAAVELALIAWVAAESPEAQLAAFDEAMTGVVLDVDQMTAVHHARDVIAAGHLID